MNKQALFDLLDRWATRDSELDDLAKNLNLSAPGKSDKPRKITPQEAISAAETVQKVGPEKKENSNPLQDIDWTQLALAGGGGLLARAIASSMFDGKTDEEKRRESIWMKLLSSMIPIGAAALGTYGGYRLGQHLKSAEANDNNSQNPIIGPTVDNAKLLEAKRTYLDANKKFQDAADVKNIQGWGSYLGGVAGASAGLSGIKPWWRAHDFVKDLDSQVSAWDKIHAEPVRIAERNLEGIRKGVRSGTIPRSVLGQFEDALKEQQIILADKEKGIVDGVPRRPTLGFRDESLFKEVPKGVVRGAKDTGRVSKWLKFRTLGGLASIPIAVLLGNAFRNAAKTRQDQANQAGDRANSIQTR